MNKTKTTPKAPFTVPATKQHDPICFSGELVISGNTSDTDLPSMNFFLKTMKKALIPLSLKKKRSHQKKLEQPYNKCYCL